MANRLETFANGRRERLGFCLVLALSWSHGAVAQKLPSACSLLTLGEIESAVGGKVAQAKEASVVIPSGPMPGETVAACIWFGS